MPVQRSASTFLPAVVAVAAGSACMLLGLTVLIGWYTHDLALLHIYHGFVAMAFNTALGFFISGTALLLVALGRGRFAWPIACGGVLIGGLTVIEYLGRCSLGIDEIFFKEYTRAGIAQFNRMAFSTATCFLLAGLGVILTVCGAKKRWMPGAIAFLGSLVAGLGTIGLSGYVVGIAASYAWGQFTRMAVHTSLGFMVLGSGLVCLADCLSYRGRSRMPRWLPLPVAIAALTITLCLWQAVVVENQAVGAAILRLSAATGQAAPSSLTSIQCLIPVGTLISGCAMALLMALAVYLAQTSEVRTKEVESANAELGRQIVERERIEEALRERERALIEAHEELENRVASRTAELAVANKQLLKQVTERKRAQGLLIAHQKKISQQQAFLRQVIDTAPTYIFVKDAHGRFTLVNQAFADAVGMSVEEMIGKHTTDTLPKEVAEPLLQKEREVIETGVECLLDDEKITTRHGQVRWLQMVKRRLVSPDGTVGVLCIATDITERKSLHSQVVQAEKLAALGELVAGVAHEINNPLTAIIGNAELLQMHPDEQVREDAETIVSMGQRATRIVRSLLTFARGTGGERRHESLNALIHGTIEMATYKLRKTNVTLTLCLDEKLPAVQVNANEIQQVILNLINNAEHAVRGNEGERMLTITTEPLMQEDRQYVRLSVADNGYGIPEEVVGSIFDPFFTTKKVGEGTGLGLSICHGIAEAHGGKLAVQSTVGNGAVFTLTLPVEVPESAPAAKAA